MIEQDIELEERLVNSSRSSSPSTPLSETSNDSLILPRTILYQNIEIQLISNNWRNSTKLTLQILLCFYIFIIIGLCDQTIGTLIPTLITHYTTTESKLTIVFILQFFGYSISAMINNFLHIKFGRIGVLFLSCTFLICPFSVIGFGSNVLMWLFISVYLIYGLGVGLLDSCLNVFASSLIDHNEIMGVLHGCYGIGSIIAPPLISKILIWEQGEFNKYYKLLTGLSVLAMIGVVALFRDENAMKYRFSIDQQDDGTTEEDFGIGSLFKDKMILLFAGYLFFYIGAELSIGSWLLTYLLQIQKLDQLNSSYIVSWFWIGLTIGRIFLGFVTKVFTNEYRANLIYSILSLISMISLSIFLLTINDIQQGNWILFEKFLVLITGVFIGPLFPTQSITLCKILPVKLHVSAVGLVTSCGGSGSAILPYLVGNISHLIGFKSLPVLITGIVSIYTIIWWLIPKYSTVAYRF